MAAITVRDLNYAYQDNGGVFPALRGLTFSVRAGEFVTVAGHSGCGKTTLLRILAGLLKPGSGQAQINGQAISGPGPDRAMVFQQYSLFPWMTAERNVRFGVSQMRTGLSKVESSRIALDYLGRVGMAEAAGKYPFQLSGGMQQRVAIARALAVDAEILLLDEPFGAVDPKTRAQLQQLLLNLWQSSGPRKTVIFVTHDIDEALFLSDRIFFMEPGRIVRCLEIPFPRPRCQEALEKTGEYAALRETLLGLFYGQGGG